MGSSSYPTISFILLYDSTSHFALSREWDLGNQRHWVTELSSVFQVSDTQSPKSQEMQLQTQDLEMGSVVFKLHFLGMEYPREEKFLNVEK